MKRLFFVVIAVLICSISFGQRYYNKTESDLRYNKVSDNINPYIIANIKSDTIPQAVFGAGDGARGSQVAFQLNKKLGAFWYGGSDTLHLSSVVAVCAQDSGTVTSGIQLYYDVNCFDGTPTAIMSGTATINSTTSGNVFTTVTGTSIASGIIPPNRWIWGTVLTKSNGNMPVFMSVTLIGYKQNRKW